MVAQIEILYWKLDYHYSSMSSESEKVIIVVRSRPLSRKEVEHACHEVVFVNSNEASVKLRKTDDDSNPRTYYFNSAYSNSGTQQFIYDDCARQIVDSVRRISWNNFRLWTDRDRQNIHNGGNSDT